MGSLDYSLGSLDLWVSSLDYCEVRWVLVQFVGFMGSSLDYRFLTSPPQVDTSNRGNP